ncbi:DUF488 domain-containing protein [bacterium]|nr:DUF488 domain-containing protein [bacterium]
MTESLYTIGYEGASLVSLIAALRRNSAALVLDVRRDPYSRKAGFKKRELEKALPAEGIAYRHEPRLGVPKEIRESFRGNVDPSSFAAWYRSEVLPVYPDLLEELAKLVGSTPTVLLCYEADPRRCHRSHLALELSRRSGLRVMHLSPFNLELNGGAFRLDN